MASRYQLKQRIITVSGFFTLVFLTIGCKKFVQISPPSTEIVTASVFNNSNTVTSALTSIYSAMYNSAESYNLGNNLGLLSDELTNYSTNQSNLQFYTNSLLAIDDNGEWDNAYSYIYQANNIIEGLGNNANISPAIVQQIKGEAKFIRAFWLFYLTNEYGAVPLVTTTDYTVNKSVARSQPAQVYSQIIADLSDAIALLNAYYVDASDTTIITDRIRPNKGAAEALLARAYLYTGKYDSAEAEASLLINNANLYQLCTDLSLLANPGSANFVFMANSTEAILQLGIPQPQGTSNTIDATNFILTTAPSTGPYNSSTISPQLLNAFEPGDQRMVNWIGVYATSSPVVNYYYPYKYQSYNTTTITEYTMVLRLAEQYLIRAEAEANLGHMADAAKDLNIIRARAGLPASTVLTASSSLAQADTAILHERQVELFTEWGNRWFDLKRTGTINNVMGSPDNVCQFKQGSWNSDWQLFPIPQNDITNDPRLGQNPGYQ